MSDDLRQVEELEKVIANLQVAMEMQAKSTRAVTQILESFDARLNSLELSRKSAENRTAKLVSIKGDKIA